MNVKVLLWQGYDVCMVYGECLLFSAEISYHFGELITQIIKLDETDV